MTPTEKSVAYLGIPGTYTYISCTEKLPDYKLVPRPGFRECLEAVEKGEVDATLMAIENSTAGRVEAVHHLLRDTSLVITGEHFHSVKHCLLAPEGTSLDNVTEILSHEQALKQCKLFIARQGATPIPCSGTAVAAKLVAQSEGGNKAVIAAELCVELYQLSVLKRDIQDMKVNTTRFIVIQKPPQTPPPQIAGKAYGTSMLIGSNDNVDGLDVVKVFDCISAQGLTVSKMETYAGNIQIKQIYIELRCHSESDACRKACANIELITTVRPMGCYELADRPSDISA
ncbi:hypothetical protein SARC_00570 [Sphaeroforma arctica JP610]|uniref:prephenate dehydratase n=1 Tax=Sphaeroforma arctica JP610 TaxID=667725 RepID=A0A0L0GEL2_9EUKA|nr:hypothetical protein SARC_00570 [Sphaeroforma arctica JP610]KNC87329.1 hypothetical protein SARC_00570 [Sphaeroforma arctica JP610]|eukprot:XP_014161231.1 hypothetical protein SARC_00570 [Sphaeroforma arctica JP610]